MLKHKNNYKVSDELFIQAIKNSISIREAILSLGLSETGTAYRTFKKRAQALNLDTSHLKGKGYLLGKTHKWAVKIPIEDILIINSTYASTTHLKERLIQEQILEYKCSGCNINSWLNKPLSLQLDHVNGISNDNRLENLRLLCPNCHSQTETFAGKNIKKSSGQRGI